MRLRIGILAAALALGAGAVVRRAWELQIEQGPELRRMAEEQYLRDIRLAPKRGTIYDRRGAELAVSVEVDSVWANPRELRRGGVTAQAAAAALARAIPGLDAAAVERRLASDRYFVWIQRRVTPQQARAVRELGLPGVSMSREARRFYPNRELAAHVLGFADVDGVGIEGLERQFEERLRGSVAAVPAIRDRRGRVVFSDQLLDERAAQGDDLELTIDKTIQAVAERELALAVRTTEARAGSVVVMDPRTGEILAIANYPTFNPNQPWESAPADRRNRAVTDRYEPGSTIKTFTIAGALAAGAIRPDQIFDCEHGAMRVAEYTIHDSHPWDELTPAQILARSSNIGTAKIGQELGRPGLFRALRRFGFGEPTGVPLPGETAGILRHYRRWYDMDAATISFGQGMSATTMQLALAMSAIANGGKLMEPLLVRRVLDGRGQALEEYTPRVRRQVVPQGTARLVADMLTAVTGPGGTGAEAAIDGYLVAGKTGTAQKADYVGGGYARDQWVGSFVGFVPAERPRLVIAVMIDEPIIEHYGGLVAGPVFRRVGEAALRHLGVPPTSGGEALAARDRARRALEGGAPGAGSGAGAHGPGALAARGDGSREGRRGPPGADGAGPVASAAAARVAEGGPAIDERAPGEGEVQVPDVAGKTARAAMARLGAVGLVGEAEGSGVVASQSPAAGEVAPRGAPVRLVLAPRAQPQDEPPGPGAGPADAEDALPARRRAGGAR
jgi:cell division protein FtsI (penicillin-binding protein 3)